MFRNVSFLLLFNVEDFFIVCIIVYNFYNTDILSRIIIIFCSEDIRGLRRRDDLFNIIVRVEIRIKFMVFFLYYII